MKIVRKINLAVAVLVLALLASVARAETPADCQAQITALRNLTASTSFIGKNAATDQASLLAKLDAAAAKLAEGKLADAVAKLQDFEAKVRQLAAQGKLAPGDADALLAGAESAIACINELSSGT
jgi:hypothetical protein